MKFIFLALMFFIVVSCRDVHPKKVNPQPMPSPSQESKECRNITFSFSGGPNAGETKTYVIWDMNEDGTFANTGNGGNGNLGHSAQIGASCCRPPADPIITAFIPDDNSHSLKVYALDSEGYFFKDNNPVATYHLNAAKRIDCSSEFEE